MTSLEMHLATILSKYSFPFLEVIGYLQYKGLEYIQDYLTPSPAYSIWAFLVITTREPNIWQKYSIWDVSFEKSGEVSIICINNSCGINYLSSYTTCILYLLMPDSSIQTLLYKTWSKPLSWFSQSLPQLSAIIRPTPDLWLLALAVHCPTHHRWWIRDTCHLPFNNSV